MNNLLDGVELYYISDIRSKRWSGVRWSKEIREQMALGRFLGRMQIVVLNILLKRKPKK